MRTKRLALSLLLLSFLVTAPVLAQPVAAPDAAVAVAPMPPVVITASTPDAGAVDIKSLPAPVSPDQTGVADFLKLIVSAAKAGDWKLAVVLGLVFLIWLTRKFGSKIPGPVGKAIASDAGGVITAFLWSFVGTLSAALSLGLKLDLHLVGEALLLSFTAMGGWVALKKLVPASWQAKMTWLFGTPATPTEPAKP